MDIFESYMKFCLDEKQTFRIEKAKVTERLTNVMPCEYIAWINDSLCLVEAKSSAPSPNSKANFDKYIHDIAQKFTDSILLFNAILLKRHKDDDFKELPDAFKKLNGKERYTLYLIVHGHKEEWMIDIQDALKMQMRHVLKAWNIEDFRLKAINHETAQNLHLIENCFPVDELEKLKKEGKAPEELESIVKKWLQEH